MGIETPRSQKPDLAPALFIDFRAFSAWVRPASIAIIAVGIVVAIGLGINAALEAGPR